MQLNDIECEAASTECDVNDLKEYILKQFKISEPITKLTPSILARFIQVIKVKADGQIEVHYRTSKPSAFYISHSIKLAIPKNHPNKACIEQYA